VLEWTSDEAMRIPRGLSRRRVEQLLSETKHDASAGRRIEVLSRHFLGVPYKPNPLIGSADAAEVFTASFDGFDCVTYIETVVALARASNVGDLPSGCERFAMNEAASNGNAAITI